MSTSMPLLSFLLSFFIFSFPSSSSSSFSNNTHMCSSKQTLALLHFKQNISSINNNDSVCQYLLGYSHYPIMMNWNTIVDCCSWDGGSSHYPIMMNWNTNVDCCSWDGVTCNYFTGDVIGLDLSCGMLKGTIHPNTTLFHLPHLQRLNLAYNDFGGSNLPHEIGSLANSLTYLNISGCGFQGQVPLEISLLPKLVSLDLSLNFFDIPSEPLFLNNLLQNSTLLRELNLASVNISWVLPTFLNITSSLKSLDLGFTGLKGKLPGNIFNLPYLEKLHLCGNRDLTYSLPKFNMSYGIPLKWLDLSKTNLSGKIPYSIGQLKSLNYLDLSGTGLSGEIPFSIGQLKSLNYMVLFESGLSGEIPSSIGQLKSLDTLIIFGCSLTGPIPKSIGNLRNLTFLGLASTMLNGTLPSSLFTISSLEAIFLGNNNFSGSIPLELFTHESLDLVSLHSNQQVGHVHQPFPQLTDLDLSFNNFSGVWELDTLLSSLPNLVGLELSYSGLSVVTTSVNHYINPYFYNLGLGSCKLTTFPKSIKAMKNLQYLDLSSNEIHGHIPNWVGKMGGNQLFYLNLSHNFITDLQQFELYGLQILYLQSNQIQGPFPPSICNMSRLYVLDMSNNSFDGVLPQCFGNFSSSLGMADLGNNHFNGTIPNVFEECGNLEGIILKGNELEGEVPSSLSKCQSLKVVDLGNNHLNGTFPVWLGGLPKMQVLVLNSNKLHGPIECSTTTKLPFPSLKVLDLSHNGFVGHLPENYIQNFRAMKNMVKKATKPEYLRIGSEYYSITLSVKDQQLLFTKIFVDYTTIDLSNNRFEGEIPIVVGSLNSLKVLNLSHNSLTGQIPHSLGNLSEIESLDLSWNQLTGEIPQSLANITNLAVLNLSQNHLMGRIPEGTQFNTFEANSFEENLGLCGIPLPKKCVHPHQPLLEDDEDSGSGFTWKVVVLGFGCGTLLGLVMGYLMLTTRTPKWFNAIYDTGELIIWRRRNKRRYVYIGK